MVFTLPPQSLLANKNNPADNISSSRSLKRIYHMCNIRWGFLQEALNSDKELLMTVSTGSVRHCITAIGLGLGFAMATPARTHYTFARNARPNGRNKSFRKR